MPNRPPSHKPPRVKFPEQRPSAARRGYGSRWRELRAYVLSLKPVCEACGREQATDVDHAVSKAKGGTDDLGNLVALCHSCHSRKTVAVDGGLGRPRREQR